MTFGSALDQVRTPACRAVFCLVEEVADSGRDPGGLREHPCDDTVRRAFQQVPGDESGPPMQNPITRNLSIPR